MRDFRAHVAGQLRRFVRGQELPDRDVPDSDLPYSDVPDSDLVEELAQDLEHRYEALLRGGSDAAEAWRLANEQMNWPRLSRELAGRFPKAYRAGARTSVLSHIGRDARYALRQLARNPGFAATAILILGVAIGANTAMFSAFDALILHPLPYRDSEQLVKITENFKKFDTVGLPTAAVELGDLRAMTGSFSHLAGIASGEFTLTGKGAAEAVAGLRVSAEIFALLGVQPILGSFFTAEQEQYGNHRAVVVSENFWRRKLGADPNIVGSSIELNRESYVVSGVTPPILGFLGTAGDLWVPLSFQPRDLEPVTRGSKYVDVIGRMKPGVTMAQVTSELEAVRSKLAALYPDGYPQDMGFSLHATGLASTVAGELRDPLLFLLAAVGVLMAIACANVSNLLMARASTRRKEMSIRAALGAGRPRVIGQLMTESLVIAAAAGVLGVAMSAAFLKLLELPSDLVRGAGVEVNGWALAFAVGVSSAGSVLFGLMPALTASAGVNEAVKESARGATAGRRRFREAMVALEVGASLVLLVGAGLLIKSFLRVQQAAPGFDPDHVLTFELLLPAAHYSEPAQRIDFYEALRSRLQAIPGVVAAGAANRIPFGGRPGGSPMRVVGRPVEPNAPQPFLRPARSLPGYFESLGVPLSRGRYFTAADTKDAPAVAIIDEATAAKFFPNGEDPIGSQITGVEPDLTSTIVGVVGSVKLTDLAAAPPMSIYHAATQKAGTAMTFTVKTATDPLAMIPAVRRELAAIDPLLPLVRTATMQQRLSDSLARRRLSMQLMAFFGVTALFLATTGLYGVLSYMVDQRRREVGIRLALGARPGQVMDLIAKQGLLPVALGISLGLGISAAAARLLTAVLYEMSPNDPIVYGLVTGILVLTAVAAIAVPARRAAMVDPVTALREE
jgi:predicted permease